MSKLPEEFKQKWIAALRSGKFKQGKFNLISKDDTYCCLGVAGCLMGIPKKSMLEKSIKSQIIYTKVTPIPLDDEVIEELTEMNDGTWGNVKYSFEQIADYIEKNL